MEAVYEKLSSEGTTSVNGIVNWLKESNLLGQSEGEKEKIEGAFRNVKDNNKVTMEEFKDAMSKLASDGLVNTQAVISSVAGAASSAVGQVFGALKQ